MTISSSVKAAGLIAFVVIGYFAFSSVFRTPAPSNASETIEKEIFRVVTRQIVPSTKGSSVIMRGTTEALRKIDVKAETPGQVLTTPTPEGSTVKQGDVLCKISIETRSAAQSEARAAYEKAILDYKAAKTLFDRGFNSEAALAGAKASLDRAEADLKRAQLDVSKTSVTAPFDGILDRQIAKPGDFLPVGAPCATVAEFNKILITGSLSSSEIIGVKPGNAATVTLATGEQLKAKVKLASSAANGMTRTFRVELEADNPGNIREGISADALIETGDGSAYMIPHSAIVINDNGTTGIRIVENIDPNSDIGDVRFIPIKILSDSASSTWITGPEGRVELIVRGQDYVAGGQKAGIAKPEKASLRESSLTDPVLTTSSPPVPFIASNRQIG